MTFLTPRWQVKSVTDNVGVVVISPEVRRDFAGYDAVERVVSQRLVGFYHAEDWRFGNVQTTSTAWKSIAHCTSEDGGLSWQKGGRIITSSVPKPPTPTWGGNGDHCVVWDHSRNRWTAFFAEHWICMAISDDHLGRPGTWRKLYGSAFSEPGLGGRNSPVSGLEHHAGGNSDNNEPK